MHNAVLTLEEPREQTLINAVRAQDINQIRFLLQFPVDLSFADIRGFSPLHYAVIRGNEEIIRLLIENGAPLFTSDTVNTGCSPLLLAYFAGRTDVVKILAEYLPNYEENLLESHSPLGMAVRHQDRLLAKEFLQTLENAPEKLRYTPLHRAVEAHELKEVEALLVHTSPEQINQQDVFGYAPLHLAVLHNDPAIVACLLAKGADPFLKTSDGQTAFDLANQKGLPGVLQALEGIHHPSEPLFISATEFKDLIEAYAEEHASSWGSEEKWHLNTLLQEKGFTPVLKDISFTDEIAYFLRAYDLSGIDFLHCEFKGLFKELHIQGKMQDCSFHAFECQECEFKPGTLITNSVFQDSLIQNTSFDDATFLNNHFFYTAIKDTALHHVNLNHNYLYGTQLWNVKFNTPVIQDLKIVESITPNIDPNSEVITFAHRTKPIVGTLGEIDEIENFSRPGFLAAKPYLCIKQVGAIPLLISREQFAKFIDSQLLQQEVDEILSTLDPTTLTESIAQAVLHTSGPQITLINTIAKQYAEQLDGLWIPGGPDVHPAFYGKTITKEMYTSSYEDDLFEFALIDHLLQMGKPVLGICHGSQLLNVYFGGTLLQDIAGHNGAIQPIQILHHEGAVGAVLKGERMWGYSAHHQAIDELAAPLEKVAEYQGIIKAAQGKTLPVWLSQFHPEYLLDDNNASLLNSFFNAVKENFESRHRGTQNPIENSTTNVLSINDVLSDPTSDVQFLQTAALEIFTRHTPFIPQDVLSLSSLEEASYHIAPFV